MPTKGSYDMVTNPDRMPYKAPPSVKTGGPEAWGSMPAKGKGIGGKYSYSGPGPKGPPPPSRV